MTEVKPYVLSIEETHGNARQHGFPLGSGFEAGKANCRGKVSCND